MKNGHTTRQKAPAGRYALLDELRGLDLISMMLYHACWDLVYLFHADWDWYRGTGAYIWQQSICWTFILLSGFCFSLGRRPLRRGLTVFGCGWVVTLVTVLFMPEEDGFRACVEWLHSLCQEGLLDIESLTQGSNLWAAKVKPPIFFPSWEAGW